MKAIKILLFIFCSAASLALFAQSNIGQATSINQNGAAPDPSAILDVQATDKGILVPRMTSTQRTSMDTPATGLLVFDTTTGGFWFFNGTSWISMSAVAGTSSAISDADSNTKIQTEESPNENVIRFDLNGTENMVLRKNAGGIPRLELTNALNNTFIGQNAGNDNNTGAFNVAIGNNALRMSTNRSHLVAVGDSALFNNGTGATQSYQASFNTAVGKKALFANTIGDHNTAVGNKALLNNTTGVGNTATGSEAMALNTSGYHNTAMGHQALVTNTSGYRNSAFGFASLLLNTTGYHNTATGFQTLINNTTGYRNTATGFQALALNTSGVENTAMGHEAMFYNTTGNYNNAYGHYALLNNTTGHSNVAIGTGALINNTIKSNLVAVGDSALFNNGLNANFPIHSQGNTAVGSKALFSNTTGNRNTANGTESLYSNTTGVSNTANGYYALYSNTTGIENSANGLEALQSNTTGGANTAFGAFALDENTVGYGNTALGAGAGSNNNNNDYCTFIGWNADQTTLADYTNSVAIGYLSTINASHQVRIGNSEVTSIGGYAGWTNLSDSRFKNKLQADVPGLSFVMKLKPVTYNLDLQGLSKHLGEDRTTASEKRSENPNDCTSQNQDAKSRIRYTGFVAQEVELAAQEIGYDFSGVDKPENEVGLYGLRYAEFVVPLVKAVQEQQVIIENQNEEINALKATLKANETKLEQQAAQLEKITTALQNLGVEWD